MNSFSCPEDDLLLPMIAGETVDATLSSHVETCPACQRRLRSLQSEVSSLRWALASTDPFEAATTPALGAPVPRAELAALATPSVTLPAMIGRYRVVGRIGGGGQAEVYRVVHPTLLSDLVCKRSREPVDPERPRDRLVAEGKLLAELNHANLARVVDLDFDGDRPFLVLELVRGRNLRQHAASRSVSPVEGARIVAQVARALAPAHAVGVIHQDIKPDNIVIDEQGHPRLIDFGMALLRGAWRVETGEPGEIGGSVAYMPPEQARGENDRVDTRSDLFALGAVLFELLTGKPPYTDKDPYKALAKAQKCDFDMDALSRAQVPGPLAAICLKALAADPAERYGSAEDFAAALERFATPKSLPWWPLVAAAAVLCGVLIAGYVALQPPAPRKAKPFQDLVHVYHDDIRYSIREVVSPSTGTTVQIRCTVPTGWNAAIYWLGSDGQLQRLPTDQIERSPTPEGDLLLYPSEQAVELSGEAGTELVLVCASPGEPPDLPEVEAAFRELGLLKKWPPLPVGSLVYMNEDGAEIQASDIYSRAPGASVASASAEVERKLDQLRQRLGTKSRFLAGLALPHLPGE
ncbi:MAG: serine/threonine-protein kinase [Pirellulaceae bacterium]|nr:serine/threonine-protein kinase [Pirellulaceae bacterium]